VLLPVLVLFAIAVVTNIDSRMKKNLDNILGVIGFILLIRGVYSISSNWEEICKIKTVLDYLLLPLLTLIFLPFIFFFMVYSTYETCFIRIDFNIKDPRLRLFAKLYGILNFHVNIKQMERWIYSLNYADNTTIEGIKASIKELKKIIIRESNPEDIPIGKGWSPYIAKTFLKEEGFITDYYRTTGFGEWYSQSKLLKLNVGLLDNYMIYYVEGDELIAKTLKLELDITSIDNAKAAKEKFLNYSQVLYLRATKTDLPTYIINSIEREENFVSTEGLYKIQVEKYEYPSEIYKRYELKFTIEMLPEDKKIYE